jgi:hypothetical protein
MKTYLPDSDLNEPEHGLQHLFRKLSYFNGLLVMGVVLATFALIRDLPDRRPLPLNVAAIAFHPVALERRAGPLRLAGAWEIKTRDRRMGGLSALAIDQGRFLAVSDLGAVIWFDPPATLGPVARVMDIGEGPGRAGRKVSRDAESLTRDPRGRGWWIGFEQRHSLWLYDDQFQAAKLAIPIVHSGWRENRGAEGLIADDDSLLVLAENGKEAIRVAADGQRSFALEAGDEVADSARAPDGTAWVLLRSKGRSGIAQSIARLDRSRTGYRLGTAWPLPKAAFDNYEGLAIAPRSGGGWRFWLVTDDGHRFMARTLLVAFDLPRPDTTNARRIRPGVQIASSGGR